MVQYIKGELNDIIPWGHCSARSRPAQLGIHHAECSPPAINYITFHGLPGTAKGVEKMFLRVRKLLHMWIAVYIQLVVLFSYTRDLSASSVSTLLEV